MLKLMLLLRPCGLWFTLINDAKHDGVQVSVSGDSWCCAGFVSFSVFAIYIYIYGCDMHE